MGGLPNILDELIQRQVGASLGRQVSRRYQEARGLAKPFTPQDYIHCIESMKEPWGWDCSVDEAAADAITFHIPVCPFGKLAADAHGVCQIESGILGGIAGDLFGQSKVTVHRGQGAPPRDCRIVVYPLRSERSVAAEGIVYPEESGARGERSPDVKHDSSLARLSQRERQILRLVGEGLSNKDIAATIHLSIRTVEGHINRLRSKLTVRGRNDLIRLALRSKLASL